MSLVDNIHKGLLKFNEEDFVLLSFNFRGDIFTDEKLVKSDVEFIGNYGITGHLEIIANINSNVPFTTDEGYFVIYKIVGNDEQFNYSIDEVFFTTQQPWLKNGRSGIRYKGSIKSELVIKAHELKNIENVVCDCIAGSIPSLSDGLNIFGRTIYFNENRNYWNNSKFVKKIFRNILGCTFQYVPILPIDYQDEKNFHDNFELVQYFITGHAFGISISKYLNSNDILIYIIKDKFTNFSANHFILDNDTNKIKELLESTDFLNKLSDEFFQETIFGLCKLHNEPDVYLKWSILIITYERFLKNVLISKGIKSDQLEEKNFLEKLRMLNTFIKKIPKKYLDDTLRKDYRNPLFHSGELVEKDLDKLTDLLFLYTDLLYNIIFDYVGYTNDFVLMSNGFEFGKLI